ncbi:MAG TPA: 7-cyano-7-deazaguanine synthase QueC [Bacteriovoracaceae bacterium]|nr:7-cyano-7-deazaguanine synthase QueC [Bacteriovoracaceae bacterium]
MKKKALVVHSGGMDSSLCLALAVQEFGALNVLSLSFDYYQRHALELDRARKISLHFKVEHVELDLACLSKITESALIGNKQKIEHNPGDAPNTLVVGRNGLMARLAGIHANSLGAHCIYMGIMELEVANSGYRDCSRAYMDLIESALRMDFADPKFEIRTPLVLMNKKETMELGNKLGELEFLLENTITCYEGIEKEGCLKCPACKLRNQGLKIFSLEYPDFKYSYREKILNLTA